MKVANEIIASKSNGFPGLGLPVLDPLKIDRMKIESGGDRPVNLKLNFKDVDLIGLSKLRFYSVSGFGSEIDKSKIELKFTIPALTIRGPYKANGRVLVLPVQGDGIASLTFCKSFYNLH